jgi:hypothetical protein
VESRPQRETFSFVALPLASIPVSAPQERDSRQEKVSRRRKIDLPIEAVKTNKKRLFQEVKFAILLVNRVATQKPCGSTRRCGRISALFAMFADTSSMQY